MDPALNNDKARQLYGEYQLSYFTLTWSYIRLLLLENWVSKASSKTDAKSSTLLSVADNDSSLNLTQKIWTVD